MFLLKLNPIEPPWYRPVCPVVGEGRRREASPYPDQSAAIKFTDPHTGHACCSVNALLHTGYIG